MKGTRVQSIVRELRGERIDIIPWTDEPRTLIARALSPATVEKIGVNEEDKTAMVVLVNDQQLSLAIGKKGQNVRLAMKLTAGISTSSVIRNIRRSGWKRQTRHSRSP